MMEDDSGALLRSLLPREWAIHEYTPDYGVDGTVEIFQYVEGDPEQAETLGETFFFQLKSVKRCSISTVELHPRYNVEKGPYRRTKGESVRAEVINFQLETDELVTIESMGSGLAVLLLLACLDSGRMYFVSLTDTIDKILTPESPNWRDKRSKRIRVPVLNELVPTTPLINLLRFYAARPKLMGLFSKVHFQWAELAHGRLELPPEQWHAMATHFATALLRLDIWTQPACEYLLTIYRVSLENLVDVLSQTSPEDVNIPVIIDFWFRLDAISRTFEDVWREWGLPTVLGQSSSYPPGWLDDRWNALPREQRLA